MGKISSGTYFSPPNSGSAADRLAMVLSFNWMRVQREWNGSSRHLDGGSGAGVRAIEVACLQNDALRYGWANHRTNSSLMAGLADHTS